MNEEGFHHDIKVMEKLYQGRWNINMMDDYYWSLRREQQNVANRRETYIRALQGKGKEQNKHLQYWY